MFRKIVTTVIVVPLAAVIIAFAVANRQMVTVSFDPFSAANPAYAATLPLFILIFVLVILGVIVGGAAAWLRQGKWRRAARKLDAEMRRAASGTGRDPQPFRHRGATARPPPAPEPAGAGHSAADTASRRPERRQPPLPALRRRGLGGRTRSIMALSIKICGLRTPETLDVALESGADLVGFVFFAPSPRNLGLEARASWASGRQGRAGKVALTVNANDETLAAIVAALKPDMLQLHGTETPERVAVVRSRFGLPVMKALPIATRADLSPIRQYANVADRLLFDARAPQEATRPGGLGKTFDWTLLAGLKVSVPYHAVGRARCR